MGEVHAYALPVAALQALLVRPGPAEVVRVRELVERALAPRTGPPPALGPLHRRVPGTPVLQPDEPTPADLADLLAGRPARVDRAPAVWRLVEAVAAGVAVSAFHGPGGRPVGLEPLRPALPALPDRVAGTCSPAAARALPGLAAWRPDVAGGPDVVVFWRSTVGPTG